MDKGKIHSVTTLDDLENYYWQQYEIASLPISKRPINTDLLTRSEREILNCTTKIDQALGLPLFINKNNKVEKEKVKKKRIFVNLRNIISTYLSYFIQIYSNFIDFLNFCLNFVFNIAITLYGPTTCGIFEIFAGDSSFAHLLLLCAVIWACSYIQKALMWPTIYIILYVFPILWHVSLCFLSAPNYPAIPSFKEALKAFTSKRKEINIFKR